MEHPVYTVADEEVAIPVGRSAVCESWTLCGNPLDQTPASFLHRSLVFLRRTLGARQNAMAVFSVWQGAQSCDGWFNSVAHTVQDFFTHLINGFGDCRTIGLVIIALLPTEMRQTPSEPSCIRLRVAVAFQSLLAALS
jgi:hypothetical protein